MPHLIVQYSANLHDALQKTALVEKLHHAALSTGVFPLGGTRTRALCCDDFCVADGHAENGFIDVVARIGRGRDDATKTWIGELLLASLRDALRGEPAAFVTAISLEIQEIDGEFSWKDNPLHRRVAERASP